MDKTFLDKLREKPRHHRHMYAAGTSLAVVAAIFAIWFTMPNANETQVVAQNTQEQRETESIFNALKGSVAQVFTGFKNIKDSAASVFGGSDQYEANKNPFQTE